MNDNVSSSENRYLQFFLDIPSELCELDAE